MKLLSACCRRLRIRSLILYIVFATFIWVVHNGLFADQDSHHADLSVYSGGTPAVPARPLATPPPVSSSYVSYLQMVCSGEEIRETFLAKPLCPCFPKALLGKNIPNTTVLLNLTWSAVESLLHTSGIGSGGHWKPANCTARRRIAVLVPYRDRERHLRAFLAHTHPVLQRQLLEYTIFVVEQEHPFVFNKGSMMNVGYIESQKTLKHDCVLFHDVDLLMENDRQIVACGAVVQHMGAYIDVFKYRVRYRTLLGGAVLLSRSTFTKLNGFSNMFWGWGGEDDDFENRVRWANTTMVRAPKSIASYSSLNHSPDVGNPKAHDRGKGLIYNPDVYAADGLNNVNYTVMATATRALYTWIHVRLHPSNGTEDSLLYEYGVSKARCTPEPEGERHEHSRVTCMYKCNQCETCAGYVYVADGDPAYCILLQDVCNHTTPSDRTEIHLKPWPSIQHFTSQY